MAQHDGLPVKQLPQQRHARLLPNDCLRSHNRMSIRWEGRMPLAVTTFPEVMRATSSARCFDIKVTVIIVSTLLCLAAASPGDQGAAYQTCLQQCLSVNCSTAAVQEHFRVQRPWYLALLRWDCPDECRHDCMWHALKFLHSRGKPVPQFHGKVCALLHILVVLCFTRGRFLKLCSALESYNYRHEKFN